MQRAELERATCCTMCALRCMLHAGRWMLWIGCDRIVRFTADASTEGEGFSAMYSDGEALPRTDPPTTVRRKSPQRVARRYCRCTLMRSGQCNTLRYTACTEHAGATCQHRT